MPKMYSAVFWLKRFSEKSFKIMEKKIFFPEQYDLDDIEKIYPLLVQFIFKIKNHTLSK